MTTDTEAAPGNTQHRFPCPSCGADLRFDPATGQLKCEHCGHESAIGDGAGPWGGAATIREMDFRAALAATPGAVEYEATRRGWVSYFNDLHKGRNAGPGWGWFIDVFAVACLVFCITGLFLLHLHARQRRMTWPLVGLGLLIPLLIALLLIH